MGVHLFPVGLVLALVLGLDVGDPLLVGVWTWGERDTDEEAARWESGKGWKADVISSFVSVGCATLSVSALFSYIFRKRNLWLSSWAQILLRWCVQSCPSCNKYDTWTTFLDKMKMRIWQMQCDEKCLVAVGRLLEYCQWIIIFIQQHKSVTDKRSTSLKDETTIHAAYWFILQCKSTLCPFSSTPLLTMRVSSACNPVIWHAVALIESFHLL